MKLIKRISILMLVIALTVLSISTFAADVTSLRLGHVVPKQDDHPYQYTAVKFAELLDVKTDGKYKINIYPGAQLGGDRDMVESIKMGTLDLGVVSAPPIAGFTPVLMGLDMPWLFNQDYTLLYRALTGEPGQKLLSKLEDEIDGLKPLAFTFQPWRHILNNEHPIYKPEDLKGLKIRTMENPVHMDIFKTLGASPTPVPYAESYTALQTGTVDGNETDFTGAYASKFYEVTKYSTISGHFNNAVLILMSKDLFNSLSSADQKAFQEAANEAADLAFALSIKIDRKYKQKMEGELEFNKLDLEAFKEAVQPVYEKYMSKYPAVEEFVKDVREMDNQSMY